MAAPSAPPAAPVSAPASAPKAAPAPAPAKAPMLVGAEAQNKFASDAFSDLDALDANDGKAPVKPTKEAAKKPDPTDADGAEASSEILATETGLEDVESAKNATGDTKPTSEQKPQKAKELREAYESVKKWKQENEPKLKRLEQAESKLKELESKNPELEKSFKAKTEAIEKRNQELESQIRLANYRQSKEYKEHSEKLSEAWQTAEQKLAGIQITSKDADGQEVARTVSMADLAAYGNMQPKDRWAKLRTDIPDPAERTAVINHIDKILELSVAANKAESKANEDAELHSKTQAEQQTQLHQTRTKLWRESNDALSKQYPHWFAKAEGDNEGNTIFNRGAALADLAMFPAELSDEMVDLLPKSVKESILAKKPFTEQQVAKLRSIVRNKAANHDRLVHQNKTLTKELAEAKKALKEFEDSSPDGVQARQPNGAPKTGIADYGAELDALERKYPNR